MSPGELRALASAERERQARLRHRVAVCTSAGCLALGSDGVRRALEDEVHAAGLAGSVEVHGTGCLGLCHAGTAVEVHGPEGEEAHRCRCLYERVDADVARRLVREHLASGTPLEEHALRSDDPLLTRQLRS